ncbi:LLM class flavin-dependent oxidoreductase [Nocardioides marmoriginsengisoli]|uniref:LLM class flavin-dependent oxidoreductase n=1 Tax=Nocardioides marmoriginsengisoli TaxID=661483 RepID=A0A3N0CB44_9ACTN|nr:LLM class flavin-dependent oxidoreductase [Nocardioides marmoriginsengisoli]RNL60675.1 LLM class flavin-dependent oxidoreductase [Nocardioides marmoriginsengisoli]
MRIGLGVRARSTDLHDALGFVERTADLPVEALWSVATPGHDPFVVASQAWSRRQALGRPVLTGIGVVPIGEWRLGSLASAAATVSELQGGGFRLGLGAGRLDSLAWRRAHGIPASARPVAALREATLALRELLAGRPTSTPGALETLVEVGIGVTPPAVPLFLGAAGPAMLALAGEVADGVYGAALAPADLPAVREALAEARRGSALTEPVQVCVAQPLVVAEDGKVARGRLVEQAAALVLPIPGLARDRGFHGQLQRLGFGADLEILERGRSEGTDLGSLAPRLSPAFVARLGIAGTPDEVGDQLAAYGGLADELSLSVATDTDVNLLARALDHARARLNDTNPREEA